MEKILIEHFGPIHACELEVNDFMVFIGEQASGKSTIAKCIYYCKSFRDKVKKMLIETLETRNTERIFTRINVQARNDFYSFFGPVSHMDAFTIKYEYYEEAYITITLHAGGVKSVNHSFSPLLDQKISALIKEVKGYCTELYKAETASLYGGLPEKMLFESAKINYSQSVSTKVDSIFRDACHYLYIPAGRSIITTLSDSLESLYKAATYVDPLTNGFIEEMMAFKKRFNNIDQLLRLKSEVQHNDIPLSYVKYAMDIGYHILKGNYDNESGQDKIHIGDKQQYVKINFASSGQQETVWIINLLLYYIVYNLDCFAFIEEPESHLFPTAQQDMMRFIVNFFNTKANNKVVIPTHSPYVLSEINNLVYASHISLVYPEAVNKIDAMVDRQIQLSPKKIGVFHISQTRTESIVDNETKLIDFSKLDEPAAQPINTLFNRIYDLEDECRGR